MRLKEGLLKYPGRYFRVSGLCPMSSEPVTAEAQVRYQTVYGGASPRAGWL